MSHLVVCIQYVISFKDPFLWVHRSSRATILLASSNLIYILHVVEFFARTPTSMRPDFSFFILMPFLGSFLKGQFLAIFTKNWILKSPKKAKKIKNPASDMDIPDINTRAKVNPSTTQSRNVVVKIDHFPYNSEKIGTDH